LTGGADKETRVCLGRITGAHGVRGEVRIRTYTQTPESIAAYGPLEDEAAARRFTVRKARAVKDGVVARLAGVDDRDAAEALSGVELYVARSALPDEMEDGEFYHADLVGLVAVSAEGSALGQVVAVQNYGAGDLLEVRPATGGKTVLVPFTEEIVPDIDFDAGWMLMLPPEGIFEDQC
jgi:16S rRNA processing protein RimM